MDKKSLITIKDFAKLTGTRAHLLRYYDTLGILKPAYVDPNSGYRYYSFYQRDLVIIIQMCVEAGIPLKRLSDYLADDYSVIRYKKLLDDITVRLEEQIQKRQQMIHRIQLCRHAASTADRIHSSPGPCRLAYPALWCLAVSFPDEGRAGFRTQADLLMHCFPKLDISMFAASGQLMKREEGRWRRYLFGMFLDDPGDWTEDSRLFCIPAGEYLCKEVSHSGIEQVWEWSAGFVKAEKLDLVLETELLVSDYNYVTPLLEQRCLLRKT